MKRLGFIILSALGFSGCGDIAGGDDGRKPGSKDPDNQMCMYGTPTVEYIVKGRVTDSNGVPIKGIVVGSEQVSSFDNGEPLSAVTNDKGEFATNVVKEMSINGILTFTDTDGEANGGEFASRNIELSTLPKSKTQKGDGAWFGGSYEVTADVKLEKK